MRRAAVAVVAAMGMIAQASNSVADPLSDPILSYRQEAATAPHEEVATTTAAAMAQGPSTTPASDSGRHDIAEQLAAHAKTDAAVASAVRSSELEFASFEQDIPEDTAAQRPPTRDQTRRLAPPGSSETTQDATGSNLGGWSAGDLKLPAHEAISTVAAGLGIVVGLFLLCTWLTRRSRPTADQNLPTEVFALLGRANLTTRHTAQLIRLGNKLVLLSMTPDGVQPLAEVIDPAEVDRIAGLCTASRKHGPTAEFKQVLEQLAREPAKGFLDHSTHR